MKKRITLLLIVVLLLHICGCSLSGPAATLPQETTTPETSDPTEPPILAPVADMELYADIILSINRYLNRGIDDFHFDTPEGALHGNDALKYCYEQLVAMEAIDPWLNEESWRECDPSRSMPNFDRTGYLDKFTIVENVLLRIDHTDTDAGGLENSKDGYVIWYYNPDGTVNHIYRGTEHLPQYKYYRFMIMSDIFFFYDTAGQVSNICFGDRHDLRSVVTPVYDSDGRLIVDNKKSRGEEMQYRYTYDTEGRLIKVEIESDPVGRRDVYDRWEISYTCDPDGKVTSKVETYIHFNGSKDDIRVSETTNYTYDSQGRVSEAMIKKERWELGQKGFNVVTSNTNRCYYTYDTQGRVLTETYYHGDILNEDGSVGSPGKEFKKDTYVYGDCYVLGDYNLQVPAF